MDILIFRTDIKTPEKVDVVKPLFNNHPHIEHWSIDTDDIDNVLRIESNGSLYENDIINLIKTYGFYCEILPE